MEEAISSDPKIVSAESILYFGYTFFAHLTTEAPSEFHYELTDDIANAIRSEEQSFISRAAPRGFAKTTWETIITPLWCICNEYKAYILLIGNAASGAMNNLDNIKNELETNQKLRSTYPRACGDGPVWRQDVIVTRNGIKVDALGCSMQIRGRLHHGNRPDLIILDDVETDENVQTPEQRTKLLRWYNRAVVKAGSPHTDYAIVGTVLHTESLLATLLKTPGYDAKRYKAIIEWPKNRDLWDKWAIIFHDLTLEETARAEACRAFYLAHQASMDEGAVLLWPERWPLYTLMEEFERDGPYAFSSERQNDPTEADSLVSSDDISYFNPKEVNLHVLEFIVGGTDPSLGKKNTGDYSAIIHVGMDSSGFFYVLNASLRRRKPDDIIKDALDLTQRPVEPWNSPLRCDRFLVEAVQFQSYFRDQVDKQSREVYAYLPTVEVHPRANKKARIMALQPLIKNGYLKFRNDGSQTTLIQQILNFPHGQDDGPDCLVMITDYMIKNRGMLGGIVVPYDIGYPMGEVA